MTTPAYRGRFAPSPTGRLHFGSLVTAVASYADARHANGEWLVRIDDVDETRTKLGAEARLLVDLASFGMVGDVPPSRQSERKALYAEALDRLIDTGLAYRCNCSRKAIAAVARSGPEGPIYPGTCRITPPAPDRPAAWRIEVNDAEITVNDRVFGKIKQNLGDDVGDFVARRIDGFTAYQLAVAVDDHTEGITDVVRGADLLWSTPRQILLQRQLGYPTPNYAHIPLVYGQDGKKLSKSDAAHPVDPRHPVDGLRSAWQHLGQIDPPQNLESVEQFWQWAIPQWRIDVIPTERKARHV